MFKIVTKKRLAAMEREASNAAIAKLVEIIRKSDKIYTEPVTLIGDNQTITNCLFLGIEGTALHVQPKASA